MEDDLKMQFSKVMEDNKQRIFRICSVYATDFEDRKDLYQDVALNVWKALPTFRNDASIDTWIYRICLNVCMQHSFKVKKVVRSAVDIDGINISDSSSDAFNDIENGERTKKLYKCISQLGEADRVLVLLFLEDLPYKIISDITGITENHVAEIKSDKKEIV